MSEHSTLVEIDGDRATIRTTTDQAKLIARGLRHFAGAGEPNWELPVPDVLACSNIVVGIEDAVSHPQS